MIGVLGVAGTGCIKHAARRCICSPHHQASRNMEHLISAVECRDSQADDLLFSPPRLSCIPPLSRIRCGSGVPNAYLS